MEMDLMILCICMSGISHMINTDSDTYYLHLYVFACLFVCM
jgi:hypothetical protein